MHRSNRNRAFQKRVYDFYHKQGRYTLPWRKTHNPYRILVSEVMLQQTQVDRVVPKYQEFLKKFPTVRTLAYAPLSDVLHVWSGLGYNRRARTLHEAAKMVVAKHSGRFPKDVSELESLPGIGPYTACAVMAFACNQPVVMIETNIRSVFIYEFFKGKKDVLDTQVYELIEATLDTKNPREWYAALMDYGAYLKKSFPNPSRNSKHHTKQVAFVGSIRQVRGAILPLLFDGAKTVGNIKKETGCSHERIEKALKGLEADRLIVQEKTRWKLAT